jgi:O-antigen/teichoic acid export membrane protein
MMAILRTNLIANFAGSLWAALLGFLLVPIYVRLMGVEAYGLVGLYATLLAASIVLDLGLSMTINRELARLAHDPSSSDDIRDLVYTMQILYWLGAAVLGLVIIAAAPWVSERWIHAASIPHEQVVRSIRCIGLVIALLFPIALYNGALYGLQRHAVLNIMTAIAGTLRGLGALAVLVLIAPRIDHYFAWQVVAALAQTAAVAAVAWHLLPRGVRTARFNPALLRAIASFAVTMGVVGVIATVLGQLDKLVLSRVLPLLEFGYYSLATTVASALSVVMWPVFTSVLPRFSQLIAIGDVRELQLAYHRAAQVLSVALIPAAMTLMVFPGEVLFVWTGRADVAVHASLAVTLLTAGFALAGLNHVPYALQIASGWTQLPLLENVIALLTIGPAMVWAGGRFGIPGVASLWVALNLGYIAIGVPVMHTRLLPGEMAPWCCRDIGLPLLGVLLVVIPARWIMPLQMSRPASFLALAATAGTALLAAAALTPYVRVLAAEGAERLRASGE